jgi:ribose transport system ATP-binding protein
MGENILEFKGINKSFFGVPVLRNVSFALQRNHILGLIGQNGAGKTTLMNILGGVIKAESGQMKLNGKAYTPRNPSDATAAGIGFIHQELNLFTYMSIAENLFIGKENKSKIKYCISGNQMQK